jgi:hypothetical protein
VRVTHMTTVFRRLDLGDVHNLRVVDSDDDTPSGSMPHTFVGTETQPVLSPPPPGNPHEEDFTQLLQHFEKKTSTRTLRRIETLPPQQLSLLHCSSPAKEGARGVVELVKSASKRPSVQRDASPWDQEDGPLLLTTTQPKLKQRSSTIKRAAPASGRSLAAVPGSKVSSSKPTLSAKAVGATSKAKGVFHQLTAAALQVRQQQDPPGIASPPPRLPQNAPVQDQRRKRTMGRNRSATIVFAYDEPSVSVQFQTISEEPDMQFYAEDGRLVVSPPPVLNAPNAPENCPDFVSEANDDIHFVECPTPPSNQSPPSASIVLTEIDPPALPHARPLSSHALHRHRQLDPVPAAAPLLATRSLRKPDVQSLPPFRTGNSRPVSPSTSRSHTPRTPRTTAGRIPPASAPSGLLYISALAAPPLPRVAPLPARPTQRSPRGARGEVQRPTPAYISISDLESAEQERRGDIVGRENAIAGIIASHAAKELALIRCDQLILCAKAEVKHRSILANRWLVELHLEVEPMLLALVTQHKREQLRHAVMTIGIDWYQSVQRSARLELMCHEELSFGALKSQHAAVARHWNEFVVEGIDYDPDPNDGGASRSHTTSPQFTLVAYDEDLSAARSHLKPDATTAQFEIRITALSVAEASARIVLCALHEREELCLHEALHRGCHQVETRNTMIALWMGAWELEFTAALAALMKTWHAERISSFAAVLEPRVRKQFTIERDSVVARALSTEEAAHRRATALLEAKHRAVIDRLHLEEREWSFSVSVAMYARTAIERHEQRERVTMVRQWESLQRTSAPDDVALAHSIVSLEALSRRRAVEDFVVHHSRLTSSFSQGLLSMTLLSSSEI